MGSTQSGTTTVTNQSSPYPGQVPSLDKLFTSANTLFDQGKFAPAAPAPPQQLVDAYTRTYNRGREGSPVIGAAKGAVTDIANWAPNAAVDRFTSLADAPGAATDAIGRLTALSDAPGAGAEAIGLLRGTASGADMGQNAYLDQTFQRAFDNLGRAVQSRFTAGGRSGSGAEAAALTSGGVDLANQIYGGDYQAGQTRKLAAAGQIGQLAQGDAGARLQAAGAAGNLAQGDTGARLQAVGGLDTALSGDATNRLRAATIAPALSATDYTDLQAQMGLGEWQDALAREAAGQPARNLAGFQGAVTGQFGGTTTQSQPYYSNTLADLLGGALGGTSIALNLKKLFG